MRSVSVVIPLFNEAGSLRELHERLTTVLGQLGCAYDIVFVDDGSRDASAEIVDTLADKDPHVAVVHFRRNFGKAAALDCGFREAQGDVVVTMDADLQDLPEELPQFLAAIDQGADCVSGWKRVRHDPWHKRLPSKLFNAVVSRVSGLALHDHNCGFKAYRKEALRDLTLYGEMHRYIPVLLFWQGFFVRELEVQHAPRRSGVSKYGVERLAKGFFDLLTVLLNTRYRTRPLHLFGLGGLLLSGLGVITLSYLTVLWFMGRGPIGNRPLLFLGLLLITVGVQLVSTGLLGELINRTQVADRPAYIIRAVRAAKVTTARTPGATQVHH